MILIRDESSQPNENTISITITKARIHINLLAISISHLGSKLMYQFDAIKQDALFLIFL